MKRAAFVAVSLLAVTVIACASPQAMAQPAQGSDAPLRVLFIGNSYTYYNAMPKMLVSLAAAALKPRQVAVKEITEGSATLEKLWNYRTTKDALSNEKWDYVILQEQSVRPISNPERMAEAVKEIDAQAKKAGAKTILYLTWPNVGKPELQAPLNRAYSKLAAETGALLAPVGPAWQIAFGLDPGLRLHIADGRHPTPTGSYIAACTFLFLISHAEPACPVLQGAAIPEREAAVAADAALKARALKPSDLM